MSENTSAPRENHFVRIDVFPSFLRILCGHVAEPGKSRRMEPIELLITDTNGSVSRDEISVGPRLDNEHRERGENGRDRGDSHRHVES